MKLSMLRNRKAYLIAGLLAALALVFAAVRGGIEVEVVEVQSGSITRTVVDTGYIQATTEYELHATQSARVEETPVEAGQAVQPGQTLVVLENLDLSMQISEARSQLSQANAAVAAAQSALRTSQLELEQARENRERIKQLLAAGAATPVEYERAQVQVEALEQQLSQQSVNLENSRQQVASISSLLQQLAAKEQQLVVKSPVAGILLSRPVEPGQVLMPGTLLAKVGNIEQLEVRTDILSDDLGEVAVGQRVAVTAPVLGPTVLSGEVKKIYPQAEERVSALGVIQRRVPVIISLSDASILKPGYEVKVAIETLNQPVGMLLPREAVRTVEGGQKEVMAVVGGRIQRRPVQLGVTSSEYVEIAGGLQVGDWVVRDGSLGLADGTRVKPLSPKK